MAALHLADALAGEEAFWDDVAAVRDHAAEDDYNESWRRAGRYARGRRRQVIARLLEVAADGETREASALNLTQAGIRMCVVRPEPPGTRPPRYAIGRRDLDRVVDGARYVARRRAGRCLACDRPISNGSAFCRSRHDEPLRAKILKDLRWAFDCAAPAILNEPIA